MTHWENPVLTFFSDEIQKPGETDFINMEKDSVIKDHFVVITG